MTYEPGYAMQTREMSEAERQIIEKYGHLFIPAPVIEAYDFKPYTDPPRAI